MSKEKQCECCHEWWYGSDVKENLCPNCYDYFKQLKRQLEEKDKEIESLTNRTNRYENMFRSRINRTGDMQKDIELYVKQLAIQELEKLKNFICDCTYIKEPDYTNVCRKIDNQIKQLKEGE